MKQYFLYVIALLSMYGCEKNTSIPFVDHSTKYQPLMVGNTWTYQTDSIIYNVTVSENADTSSYLLKNIVESSFIDAEGVETYVLSEYTFKDSIAGWVFEKKYTQLKTAYEVRRTINDATEVTLIFPLTEGNDWDGNQYSNKDAIEYSMEKTHSPASFYGISYDSTSTVLQDEQQNVINSFYVQETYAANVGMVYRRDEHIKNVGKTNAFGHTVIQTLISFEK